MRQISNDPNNLVIGIVRNKEETEKRVAAEFPSRSNIHLLQGDLVDYASLKVCRRKGSETCLMLSVKLRFTRLPQRIPPR